MKLRSPAKINLNLRIAGRRPDGYHELDTLMVPISLADEISVKTSIGRRVWIYTDEPGVPVGPDNLATKAAHLFSRETGHRFGAEIEIQKNIPMGAGLGGGSSNAAAVLIALDQIFETHLSTEKLESLASALGSDVAFFIRRVPARCEGRGEKITPVDFPHKISLLLLKPSFGVGTPWAYSRWKHSLSLPGDYEAVQDLGWIQIVNDLERPVFEKFILLPIMKNWLRQQPETVAAAMSGSGSTMFAILKEGADGPSLEARAKEEFGSGLWTVLCEAP